MKTLLYLIALATVITSCNHAYYSPNTPNAPLLTQKGEVVASALYSEGGATEFKGGEAQVAVAVTNHVGVMASGMWVGKSENTSYSSSTKIESGKGSYIELAGGLSTKLDKPGKWIGEVYLGTGFGTANNDYGNNQTSKVGSTKLFFQPAVGFKSKYFEFALVPRFSIVNWKVKQDGLPPLDPTYPNYDKKQLELVRNKGSFFCFEPALILKAGVEGVKVQWGVSISNPGNYEIADMMETAVAHFGISVDLKPSKAKK